MTSFDTLDIHEYSLDDLRRLRLASLPFLLVIQYLCAAILIVAPIRLRAGDPVALAAILTTTLVAAVLLHHLSPSGAGLLLVASWFGVWSVLLWLLPGGSAVWFGGAVVGAAGALFGPGGGLCTALMVSGMLFAAAHSAVLPADLAAAGLFLIWWLTLLFWLTARPVTTFLGWAWTSYLEARESRDQLRQRQGELNRALKSLEIAYSRLEHLNDELNRARRLAEEAQLFKSRFAASLSHELRTPLNLIIGFSEMMVALPHTYGRTPLPASYQADIAAIYHNARHLSGLIDDVLDLSQIEAGRMGLSREWSDLASIIEEAARAIALRFESLGLRIELSLDRDIPPVFVDRTRIRQVLINLLNNAARFTERGGVRISTRRQGNEVVVSVADTGVGIAPEELPHVFDEFFQARSSLRNRVGGSGLGLTISKHLVELHGGSMWAESTPGVGSTFSFTLPLVENVAAGTLPGEWQIWERVHGYADRAKPTLVVLSEEEEVLRTFQRHLDGYEVIGASNWSLTASAEAPDTVRGIIATGTTLEECLDRIATLPTGEVVTPVALVVMPGEHGRAAQLGVIRYLTKPISREKIGQLLRELGRKRRTILVVDDNPDMVRLLDHLIRSFGRRYQVLQATSGEEALQIMSEQVPDVVLLDLIMPGMSGIAVLTAMRARETLREVPVVAISAGAALVETRTVGMVCFTRENGLSIDEVMQCITDCFQALRPARASRSEPVLPGDPLAAPV
jgi:signal transduction histidine kinase/CheY-like chemotaxis protein